MSKVRYGSTFDALRARIANASPGHVDEIAIPRTGALVATGAGVIGDSHHRRVIDALTVLDHAVAGVLAEAVVSDQDSDGRGRQVELTFPTMGRSPLWTARIRQPDLVTPAVVHAARRRVARLEIDLRGVDLRHCGKGLFVQTLCAGTGTDNAAVALLSDFARSRGYIVRESREEVHRLRVDDPSFVLRFAVRRRGGGH